MKRIVFYSWQSDLPNACNRGFIGSALELAAAAISADESVAVEPVIDRDTANVPGSPDIAATIFGKISAADVFVADISIVVTAEGKRSCPNPNVLIELGYALRTLGHERMILVFNTAFGTLEALPFDLRARRVLAYEMGESVADRTPTRRTVTKQLDGALRAALNAVPPSEIKSSPALLIEAIENGRPNRVSLLKRTLRGILEKLAAIEPPKHRDGGTSDQLMAAIAATQEVIADYSRVMEAIAASDDVESVVETLRWFGSVLERYDLPAGYQGTFSEADHDFFRFVGNEMFVSLTAFLLRDRRWATLRRVLDEPIAVRDYRTARALNWEYVSQYVVQLDPENRQRSVASRADVLNDRHAGNGALATVLPIEEFAAADFFLYLASSASAVAAQPPRRLWSAWSCPCLKACPRFLLDAVVKRYALGLIEAFGLTGFDDLRRLLREYGPAAIQSVNRNAWWRYPVTNDQIDHIGTR